MKLAVRVEAGNMGRGFMGQLFTYNLGHAALAYLGYLRGYSYVHEPFDIKGYNRTMKLPLMGIL